MQTTLLLSYAGPPLLGAFIGYLTNKVAIRMLFRPLKPWRLFGLKDLSERIPERLEQVGLAARAKSPAPILPNAAIANDTIITLLGYTIPTRVSNRPIPAKPATR